MLELESSISGNIGNFFQGGFFFLFLVLGWEVAQVALINTTDDVYEPQRFLNINSANYHSIINGISKSEAINLLQKVDLAVKIGAL